MFRRATEDPALAPGGPARRRLRQPLLRRARFLTAQPGSYRGLPGPRNHAPRPSRRRGVRSPATAVRRGGFHHRRSDRRCLAAVRRRTPRRRAARPFDRRSDRRAHSGCPDTHVAVVRADRLGRGRRHLAPRDGAVHALAAGHRRGLPVRSHEPSASPARRRLRPGCARICRALRDGAASAGDRQRMVMAPRTCSTSLARMWPTKSANGPCRA